MDVVHVFRSEEYDVVISGHAKSVEEVIDYNFADLLSILSNMIDDFLSSTQECTKDD